MLVLAENEYTTRCGREKNFRLSESYSVKFKNKLGQPYTLRFYCNSRRGHRAVEIYARRKMNPGHELISVTYE